MVPGSKNMRANKPKMVGKKNTNHFGFFNSPHIELQVMVRWNPLIFWKGHAQNMLVVVIYTSVLSFAFTKLGTKIANS